MKATKYSIHPQSVDDGIAFLSFTKKREFMTTDTIFLKEFCGLAHRILTTVLAWNLYYCIFYVAFVIIILFSWISKPKMCSITYAFRKCLIKKIDICIISSLSLFLCLKHSTTSRVLQNNRRKISFPIACILLFGNFISNRKTSI